MQANVSLPAQAERGRVKTGLYRVSNGAASVSKRELETNEIVFAYCYPRPNFAAVIYIKKIIKSSLRWNHALRDVIVLLETVGRSIRS